jgi:hypothetical protein
MRYSRTPFVRSLVKTVSVPTHAIEPKIGRRRGKLEANPDPLPIATDTPRMADHPVPTTRTIRPERRDLRTVGPSRDWEPLWPVGSGIDRTTNLPI